MSIDYWSKLESSNIYHIYNRGINGENIFLGDDNYKFFLSKWKKYLSNYVDTLAYCLMPNHIHFLCLVKEIDSGFLSHVNSEKTRFSLKFLNSEVEVNSFLEDQFKRLFSSYVLAFNKQQKRQGSLMQKRFKRVRVSNDVRMTNLICYVHHNPIHHRFAQNYESWKYSSYNKILSQSSNLLEWSKVLDLYDSEDSKLAMKEFLRHHKEYKEEYLQSVNDYGIFKE